MSEVRAITDESLAQAAAIVRGGGVIGIAQVGRDDIVQLVPHLVQRILATTVARQFLRQQVEGAACAEVVAEIFARQVVGASRTDQPQYIAGLRDIAARHPHLALPFLRWVPPEARGAAIGVRTAA